MSAARISRRQLLQRMGAVASAGLVAACQPKVVEKVVERTVVVEKEVAKEVTVVVKEAVEVEKEVTRVVEKPAEVQPAEEKITLRVQTNSGVRTHKPREFGRVFTENNPSIELVYEDVPYDEVARKTELQYATGTCPDMLHTFTRWFHMGCHLGWYLPLDDLLESTDAIPDYPDDFYMSSIENEKWEGKTHLVPEAVWAGAPTVIYWNRSLFDAAGVAPPTTDMDLYDLLDLVLKVTDEDQGIFGMQTDIGTQARLASTVRSWGKPEYGLQGDTSTWTVSPDGREFRFVDNPGAVAWYNTWYRVMLDARAHPTSQDAVQGGLFAAGRVAIGHGHQAGPYRAYLAIAGRWEFDTTDSMLFPKGPDGRRGTCHECAGKCIYSKTKYPEETLRLIGEITSYEAGRWDLTSTRGSGYVARKSVFLDPLILRVHPIHRQIHELLEAGIVEPYSMPYNLRDQEFLDVYRNMMNPLLDGTETWDAYAPIVEEEVQKLFDQSRP